MKNYIELRYCECVCEWIDDDYEVKFIDDGESWGTQFMEFAEYCEKYVPNHKIPTIRQFFKFFEQANLNEGIIKEFWENEEYFDYDGEDLLLDYNTCKKEMLLYYNKDVDFEEFLDRIEDWMDDDILKIDFPLFCGYNAGVVGYSQRAYYITTSDTDTSFVVDLWEGWNFYNVSILSEQGEIVDSICQCYLTNNEDLEECVKSNFGIDKDDINLIKNECSVYSKYPVFEMIPTSYNFIRVK